MASSQRTERIHAAQPSGNGRPPEAHDPRAGNGLLNGLPPDAREAVLASCEPITLKLNDVVVEPGKPITRALFATSAVFSVLTTMPDGRAVEVGTAGPEGMIGIPLLLNTDWMNRTVVAQVPGDALSIERDRFREVVDAHPVLRDRLFRYAQAFSEDVMQSVACNRLHTLEQRFARWILKSHDRIRGDCLPLTQQYLAFMLGVRRAGVSVAAESLQRAGLIRYQRGKIMVVDRDRLEEVACPCYRINRDNFRQMLGDELHGTTVAG